MSDWIKIFDRKFYSHYQANWDDLLFREKILAVLRPESIVLDLGAGAGIIREMNFRGLCSKVCGIDPESIVLKNPYLDEAKIGVGELIPYENSVFDFVIADNVMEHLHNPATILNEIYRVLKPNGKLLFKTPNIWHYMPMIARITPYSFHKYMNKMRGRKSTDIFPTVYNINSFKKIKTLAEDSQFHIDTIQYFEGRPEYLRFTILTYIFGYFWERCVNRFTWLSRFRILMIVCLSKEKI